MMDGQTAKLLDLLHRGGAYAHYNTPDSGEWYTDDKGEKYQARLSLWWPTERRLPVPASWANRSVHFSIHPSTQIPPTNRQGKATKQKYIKCQMAYIAAINCVYGEFDAKDWGTKDAIRGHLATLPLAPTALVDSGGGYHCYWILTDPVTVTDDNRDHIKRLQYAWADLICSDEDAKDLARMLRVPGFKNMKPEYAPNNPVVAIVDFDPARLCPVAQIEELTADIRRQMEERHQRATPAPGSKTYTENLATAIDCLARIRPSRADDRDQWIDVGMMLSELGDTGLQLWDDWSKNSEKYKPNECARIWRGFEPGKGRGLGSLVLLASEDSPLPKGESKKSRRPAAKAQAAVGDEADQVAPAGDDPDDPEYDPEIAEFNRWVADNPVEPAPLSEAVEVATADKIATKLEESAKNPKAERRALLNTSPDDEGNAQAVYYFHGDQYAFTDAYGWMRYTGKHWTPALAERDLNLAVTATLIRRQRAGLRYQDENIVRAAKPSRSHKENAKAQLKDLVWHDITEYDQDRNLLNTLNGVVDLRTGELISHSPSHLFTYCAPAEYNPATDWAPWLDFLADVVGDYVELAEWLQQAAGYSFSGYTNEECAFYIYGPSRSGKGTFANCLLATMGKPLATGVAASMFTMRRQADSQNFDLAPLKPARLVFASETGINQKLNGPLIRQITGNDEIRCAFKNKDQFSYVPSYKIWFMSNSLVKMDDPGEAANWGRLRVLQFPYGRLGSEDKRLKDNMSNSPEMRQAILAWAVEGARQWINSANGLVTPAPVAAVTRQHQLAQDSVQAWMEEAAVTGPGLVASVANLYQSYLAFCLAQGREYEEKIGFGKQMSDKGYKSENKRIGGRNSERCYSGIALRE